MSGWGDPQDDGPGGSDRQQELNDQILAEQEKLKQSNQRVNLKRKKMI